MWLLPVRLLLKKVTIFSGSKNISADLLLSINEFVRSLDSRVEDRLGCPHFDLQQAQVDPEDSRASQLLRALDLVSDILLQARHADFHQSFRKDAGRQELSQDGLDLLGCYERVGILHKTLTTFHVAFL